MNNNKDHPQSGTDPISTAIANNEISRRLKLMYREVEEEGIPDRFLTLLEKLDKAEEQQTGDNSDE